MSKKLFPVFVILCVGYVGFCLFMYQQQDELMYNPQPKKVSPIEVQAEAAHIVEVKTKDGLILEGWYFEPIDPDKPTIVLFHGNGWTVARSFEHVRFLISAGYGLLMPEYRGYAGHKGKVTELGLYHDARAYIDWLSVVRKINPNDMIFYGESLGSAIAVKMAAEYQPKGVVLLSAFSSMQDLAWHKYPYLPVPILLRDKYRNDQVISGITAPKLFLAGRKDQLVPSKYGQKLFDKAKEPKEIVFYDEGTHTNLYDQGGREQILGFLKNLEDE